MNPNVFSSLLSHVQTVLTRRLVYLPVFFCLCLLFFYFSNPWYPAAKLHVHGLVSALPAKLMIQWTSGYGLNGYEMNRYTLQTWPKAVDDSGIAVTVTRTGNKHPAAADSQVILSKILVDGESFVPHSGQAGPSIKIEEGILNFKEVQAKLFFRVKPRHHLRFEFLAYNYAGEVEVNFGGEVSRHLLYSAWDRTKWTADNVVVVDYWLAQSDGAFAVSMDMPRYPLDAVKVSSKRDISQLSLQVATEDGRIIKIENAIPVPEGAVYEMAKTDRRLIRYFHPHRFAFQIAFALLTTWLFFGMIGFLSRFANPADLFIGKERYIFWLMFFFGGCVFALWHISFWPGITSTDSLKIWRAAHIPGMYLGDHPPLNVIFYQYLSYFWNNVAVAPIVQNVLTTALISWVFYSMRRWGLPLLVLVPCYLFTVFSVPIGLYTIILWKDIPFALLTVFLGFRLADIFYQKRIGELKVTGHSWLILFFLALVLTGFRYNGAVYLIVIPMLLFCLGIIPVRKKILIACTCLITFSGLFYSVSQYFGTSVSSYFTQQTKTYLIQIKDKMSVDFVQKRWIKYLGIFDITQSAMQWDHVENCLYGRFNNTLIRRLRWNDVYAYLPLPRSEIQKKMARSALGIYKKTYRKPWVYFSWNPKYVLFLFPLLPLFYRKLPMSAVFSAFILVEVAALVCIDIFNWRYYYFAHLASYFVVPLIVADLTRRKKPVVA